MVVGSPTKLNLIPSGVMPVVYINQGDAGYDKEFLIYNGDSPYNVPAGVSATIRGKKADGYGVTEAAALTEGSNLVTITITEQMVAAAGANLYELVFVDTDGLRIATINMIWAVKPDALGDSVISDSDLDYVSQAMDRIQGADAMRSQMNANTAAISAETAARIAADNTLQNNINAEASTRAAQDGNLQAQINQIIAPSGEAPSAAEVQNARVGADGVTYQTLGEAIRTNDTELKSQIDAIADVELLNGFTALTESGYYGENGEVIDSSSFKRSEVYVEVKPSTQYSAWWARYATSFTAMSALFGVCFYDSNKTCLGRSASSHTFTTPQNCKYIRTYLSATAYTNYLYSMLTKGTTAPAYFIPYGYDVITAYEEKCGESYGNSFSNELKLIDALTIADGAKEYTLDSETSKTATTGYYTNAIGVVNESALWNTYRCNIEPNAKYYVKASAASGAYAITVFDKNGKRLLALPSTLANSTLDGMIDTPATASYAILNASTSITVSLKKVTGIRLSATADTSANVLFGKKLYCGGDSITEGANVGSFPNGYKKTYGGFVATRNSMTYVADGVGGSTMGKCTIDGAVHNNFITSRYQNIPTDADYITLWFGWNDQAYGWKSARDAYCVTTYGNYYSALTSAEQATVDAYKTWRQWIAEYAGTKDSTDITTWGGAWNTVLTWLLNNCDESHVGVVIAYGITDELSSVLIAICEKYGIPYVKAYDPHEFFSVGHSQGIGTDQATRRKAVYTLDNTHPNELGYEMMSNSYEQFLLRT